jgi:hypothetical protein
LQKGVTCNPTAAGAIAPAVGRRISGAARDRPAKDRYLADPADCGACALRLACLKPGQDRRVLVAQRSRPTGAMRHKLRRPDARQRYARRKAIVEPVLGQLKEDRSRDHPPRRSLSGPALPGARRSARRRTRDPAS